MSSWIAQVLEEGPVWPGWSGTLSGEAPLAPKGPAGIDWEERREQLMDVQWLG